MRHEPRGSLGAAGPAPPALKHLNLMTVPQHGIGEKIICPYRVVRGVLRPASRTTRAGYGKERGLDGQTPLAQRVKGKLGRSGEAAR
jgi:hypothetical protein